MSEIGEIFKILSDHKKEKKKSNKEYSTNFLIKCGFDFESKNNGDHLIISFMGKKADFWPSTGKYIIRGGQYRRGVRNLVRDLISLQKQHN